MSNMSYCRFENTRDDLTECLDALRNNESLSHQETVKGKAMFEEFLTFCKEEGIIEEFDRDTLIALFRFHEEKEEAEDA